MVKTYAFAVIPVRNELCSNRGEVAFLVRQLRLMHFFMQGVGKMKIIISFALSLVLIIALAACGNNDEHDKFSTQKDTNAVTTTGDNVAVGDDTTAGNETTVGDTTEDIVTTTHPSDSTAPHVHAYGAWEMIKEATCEEKGQMETVCSCGEKIIVTVPAMGHIERVVPEVAPSCTRTGLTEGKQCFVCKKILVKQESVSKLEHTYGDWLIIKNATCVDTGVKQKLCYCGHKIIENIPVSKHFAVIDTAVSPTCTKTGLTEGSHCSVCGEILIAQEIVPAKGFSDGLSYSFDSNSKTYTVIGIGTCTDTEIYIPRKVGNYKVTGIGAGAFKGCKDITHVEIPNNIEYIGSSAFSGCTSLKSVSIPWSVTGIGSGAFYNCTSLEYVEIPGNVASIENSTFNNCTSLISVEIPDGISSIGVNAFTGCASLKSVVIPWRVQTIGSYAFYGCESITIYCEAERSSSGWASNWCPSYNKVVWGYEV